MYAGEGKLKDCGGLWGMGIEWGRRWDGRDDGELRRASGRGMVGGSRGQVGRGGREDGGLQRASGCGMVGSRGQVGGGKVKRFN